MSKTTPPTLFYLQSIAPVKFELYVADLFKSEGYKVTTTSTTGDQGVDLHIRKEDEVAVVQCKRFSGSVGEPIIRDLYGTMMHFHSNKAYLVTTGTFTRQAKDWVTDKPIELIDGVRVEQWARRIYERNSLVESRELEAKLTKNKFSFEFPEPLPRLGEDKFSIEVVETQPKIIKIPLLPVFGLLAIFLCFLMLSVVTSLTETALSNRTIRLPTRAVLPTSEPLPTSDPNLELQQELLSIEGVQQIENVKSVKSTDGYTVFINASVENGYVDGEVAKEMLVISENLFDEDIFQFVVFLEDNTRTVNYVWSEITDRWTLASRDS